MNSLSVSLFQGCVTHNQAQKAIDLYQHIRTPDDVITTLFFTACAQLRGEEALKSLKTVLSTLSKSSLSNPILLTSLLDALMKCGDASSAQLFFDQSTRKDLPMYRVMMKGERKVVIMNSLFVSLFQGYVANNQAQKAIDLYRHIRTPDDITNTLFFTACAQLRGEEALKSLKTVLSTVSKSSLSNPILVTSLLDALMKCGDVSSAQLYFDRSPRKVLPMYGAMMKGTKEINDCSLRSSLLGYTLNEMPMRAVKLFDEIEEKISERQIPLRRNNDHVESAWIIYLCVVNALSQIGDLSMSEVIAAKIPTSSLPFISLQNALIDMWVS